MSNTQFQIKQSVYSHPEYLKELQYQKREAFNYFLDRLAINTLKGGACGFAFIMLFRAKFHYVGLFTGIAAGATVNNLAI